MSEAMTAEEFHKKYSKKKSKYGVAAPSERTWRGKTYASKAEMLYAQAIGSCKETVIEIVEQPRLWLGVPENVYVPDFLIIASIIESETESSAYYVDVKGVETAAFKKIKKLWAAYGRLPLKIVKHERGYFRTVEIIQPGAKQ